MLVGKETFAVYGALAEGPHCGLYVCQLHVSACGELLWHEAGYEQLLSESEDYAMVCAQYTEEASIGTKQSASFRFMFAILLGHAHLRWREILSVYVS